MESPGVLYQWKNSGGIIPGATNKTYTTPYTGTYYMQKTDITGCSLTGPGSTLQNYPGASVKITNTGSLDICSSGSVTLNAHVKPGYRYQWYNNSAIIAGATSSTYVVTSAGSYKYLATTSNGCTKFSATKSVTGCREELTANGSGEEIRMEVYPNPSDGRFTLRIPLDGFGEAPVEIKLFNTLGVLMGSEKLVVTDDELNYPIQLPESVPQGIYLLQVRSGTRMGYGRIIVQR
jgi:hypothetical protein